MNSATPLSRNTDFTAAVTDRDSIVAVAGAGKREPLGKNLSPQLEQIMEQRKASISTAPGRSGCRYSGERRAVRGGGGRPHPVRRRRVGAGTLCLSGGSSPPARGRHKLAQAVAGFWAGTWRLR